MIVEIEVDETVALAGLTDDAIKAEMKARQLDAGPLWEDEAEDILRAGDTNRAIDLLCRMFPRLEHLRPHRHA
jgi:hypothetical protein